MKKGLALIYNPHNLLEFIWYSCTYSKDTEWDALCLPSGHMGEYMSEYCEKSGMFKKIYASDKNYSQAGMKEQLGEFASMFSHALTGRRAGYCKKTLNRYVDDIARYDELVVLNDIGLVGGLMIALGREKRVVILEDGVIDRLLKKVAFEFWEKADETHSVVRFVTGWSTTDEDLDALENALQEVLN
jgi:hypothetical protein